MLWHFCHFLLAFLKSGSIFVYKGVKSCMLITRDISFPPDLSQATLQSHTLHSILLSARMSTSVEGLLPQHIRNVISTDLVPNHSTFFISHADTFYVRSGERHRRHPGTDFALSRCSQCSQYRRCRVGTNRNQKGEMIEVQNVQESPTPISLYSIYPLLVSEP